MSLDAKHPEHYLHNMRVGLKAIDVSPFAKKRINKKFGEAVLYRPTTLFYPAILHDIGKLVCTK